MGGGTKDVFAGVVVFVELVTKILVDETKSEILDVDCSILVETTVMAGLVVRLSVVTGSVVCSEDIALVLLVSKIQLRLHVFQLFPCYINKFSAKMDGGFNEFLSSMLPSKPSHTYETYL